MNYLVQNYLQGIGKGKPIFVKKQEFNALFISVESRIDAGFSPKSLMPYTEFQPMNSYRENALA